MVGPQNGDIGMADVVWRFFNATGGVRAPSDWRALQLLTAPENVVEVVAAITQVLNSAAVAGNVQCFRP